MKLAASSDKTISKAKDLVRTGKWQEVKSLNDSEVDILELQSLRNVRDELVVYSDNVLLRNGCIVLPKLPRARAINIVHEGHQGISRTKTFLLSRVVSRSERRCRKRTEALSSVPECYRQAEPFLSPCRCRICHLDTRNTLVPTSVAHFRQVNICLSLLMTACIPCCRNYEVN